MDCTSTHPSSHITIYILKSIYPEIFETSIILFMHIRVYTATVLSSPV